MLGLKFLGLFCRFFVLCELLVNVAAAIFFPPFLHVTETRVHCKLLVGHYIVGHERQHLGLSVE